MQTLLNQTLIPVTMLASSLYLRTRFSRVQLLGAALVLAGALLSSATASEQPHDAQQQQQESRWYAHLVFFLSNIPVACSQVRRVFRVVLVQGGMDGGWLGIAVVWAG